MLKCVFLFILIYLCSRNSFLPTTVFRAWDGGLHPWMKVVNNESNLCHWFTRAWHENNCIVQGLSLWEKYNTKSFGGGHRLQVIQSSFSCQLLNFNCFLLIKFCGLMIMYACLKNSAPHYLSFLFKEPFLMKVSLSTKFLVELNSTFHYIGMRP